MSSKTKNLPVRMAPIKNVRITYIRSSDITGRILARKLIGVWRHEELR